MAREFLFGYFPHISSEVQSKIPSDGRLRGPSSCTFEEIKFAEQSGDTEREERASSDSRIVFNLIPPEDVRVKGVTGSIARGQFLAFDPHMKCAISAEKFVISLF